jgi:2-methylcitrate dehydratase PrpD
LNTATQCDRLLVDFITGLRFEDLTAADVNVAKAGIFDCLAVMVSGSQSPTVTLLRDEMATWGGQGSAVVVGYPQPAPAVWANLVNGAAANAEHFDDLSPAMLAHPSCVIVPALLSCASVKPLSGRQWLCAYACGFEVGGKLSRAINPALYEMGFHATSVLGVVMAAAVAAYLLALDAETTLSALGIWTARQLRQHDHGPACGTCRQSGLLGSQLGR